MQLTSLGNEVGFGTVSDTDEVRFLVVEIQESGATDQYLLNGPLLEVMKKVAEDLPKQEDWEIEEDGEYDLSSAQSILDVLKNKRDECAEDSTTYLIIDLERNSTVLSPNC